MAPKLTRFGPPPGTAGVSVIESTGSNALPDPRFGSAVFVGCLKRGPEDVLVPVNSRQAYDQMFGDPSDPRWHLYDRGDKLTPDAIDGFFGNGGSNAVLWLLRLGLDGTTKKAKTVIKNRMGSPVLEVVAANGGRWAGQYQKIAQRPVIYATQRTFTLVAPDVRPNEFAGAKVVFTNVSAKEYEVIANTGAYENGEVIFTVGAQYDLFDDGVSGPIALTGTAEYTVRKDLTGTVSFARFRNLTGTAQVNGMVITGSGTQFSTELVVGGTVYYSGEARVIQSVSGNTTATIDEPFTAEFATGVTLQTDNLSLVGTGTAFATELAVGDRVYAEIDGVLQSRQVAAITSATALTLSSGFTAALTAGTLVQTDNFEITGTSTTFTSQVTAGQYIIDPNRVSQALKVVTVNSATSLTVEGQFSGNFAGVQLTKQTQRAEVTLDADPTEGLAVEIVQGQQYPLTHFGLIAYFNGSEILRIADLSLDPADPLYAEDVVRKANLGYSAGGDSYPIWLTVKNLWTSVYTTNPGTDVRPANGSGQVLALTKDKIYSIAEFDYDRTIGRLIYPNPYPQSAGQPRNYFKVVRAQAPLTLQGTVSSIGVNVTGVATAFLDELKPGDYLYDPATNTARKVRIVVSQTALELDSAFPEDMDALTETKRLGWLGVDRGYDLTLQTAVGKYFVVQYPQSLEGGYDGDTANIIPWHYTQHADLDRNTIEAATWGRNMGLLRIATPGISDTAIQKAFVAYAEGRAYEYRGEVPSYYRTSASVEVFLRNELGLSNNLTLIFPSYAWISNPKGAGDRLISISGDVMGGETRAAAAAEGYHVPFAGTSAKLPRIVRTPAFVTPADEAILGPAGIQQLRIENGNFVVWDVTSPAIDDIFRMTHIRRIQSNMIRVFREAAALRNLLFALNQPETEDELRMILANYMRREYKKGVINRQFGYKQVVSIQIGERTSSAINDEGSIDSLVASTGGVLSAEVRYVPAGVIREIKIGLGPQLLSATLTSTLSSLG